jgi:hypothetical protein
MRDRSPEEHAHWDAVEDAVELLHEERFREAIAKLGEVIKTDPKNPYAYQTRTPTTSSASRSTRSAS